MWELTFYVIGLAVFLAVMHYIVEPEKLFEDIKKLRGSEQRITSLEQEVKELKQVVVDSSNQCNTLLNHV